MLRDTRRSSKPEYRARYPDARPLSQVNRARRQRPRTVELMAGCLVRCASDPLSSGRSLKVRRLFREQDQAGALPAALTILRREIPVSARTPHRPGRGGSTPPSRRARAASIAAMQRSLRPQSTGQHRGSPPAFAPRFAPGYGSASHPRSSSGEGCRAAARRSEGGRSYQHADVAQQRQQQFRKLPGSAPHESASLSVGPSMLP